MRSTFLPFSRPSITETDIAAVADVLRSGWITTGSKAEQFEQRFAETVGARGGVALTSGTAGMHLMLLALGIGPGDEVVTPSMTWVSIANLVVLAGAKPVFADIDRDHMMVDRSAIEACLTPRTRLIVPVHFGGATAPMGPIRELAAGRGIPVLEDAAHALGSEYQGERIGRRGHSVFSFHPSKNLTTGEGGMVCSDDPALLDRIRCLKFHGLAKDAFGRQSQGRLPQAQVTEPGYKYNLTDVAAVMGLTQLERLERMNARRAELADLYRERFAGVDEILPLGPAPWTTRHAWHLFVVRVDLERARLTRDEFMAELKRRNIGTGLHFLAIHLQSYYAAAGFARRGSLPNTEWNSERICSLPLFPDMTDRDVDDVVDAIKDVLAHARGRVEMRRD